MSTADCPEIWRGEIEGSWITRRRLELPLELPPGTARAGGARSAPARSSRCPLVLSPTQCYEPEAIRRGRRLWGVAVQLYTVRSRSNWGIGDFGDLKALIRWLAPRGAGFIGLNPLHALAPADPARASPYSASNRHFLNVLYIAVRECARARALREPHRRASRSRPSRRACASCARLRSSTIAGVAEVKLEILRLLFGEFLPAASRRRHRARASRSRASWRPAAQLLAAARALRCARPASRVDAGHAFGLAQLAARSSDDPNSSACDALCGANIRATSSSICICNGWRTSSSRAAQALARELGMPIGLYGDYAVGTHPSGSETWVDQTGYRMGAEIGAPPDPLALRGQGWGLPPPDPVVMESQHLEGFVSPDSRQHALLRRLAARSRDVAVPALVGGGRPLAGGRRLRALSAAALARQAGAGERALRVRGRRRGSRRRA